MNRRPPEYFVTDVKALENCGEYFRIELGGTKPVVLNVLPTAYEELARRVVMSDATIDARLPS